MAELTYEHVLELFAETNRQISESNKKSGEIEKRMDQTFQRLSDEISKSNKEISRVNKELSQKIGELGEIWGRFAHEQVRADLIDKFGRWGIPVHAITNNYVQKNNNNEFVYEVDILIYNSQYAIALEVKNTLKKDHVDEHLERMRKIQKFPMVGLQGKTLLAGVAAMMVSEGVDKYAENKGLFVLKPSGDTVKIANNKKTFKPQEWEII